MKKTLLLLLLSGLLIASCDKPRDWTCACTIGSQPDTTIITNQKEDDAKTLCKGIANTAHTNRIAADCTLTEKK